MNPELEKILQQKIEELKQIAKEYTKQLYGDINEFTTIKLEERLIHHYIEDTVERVLQFYVNTDKGDFSVEKKYTIPTDDEI